MSVAVTPSLAEARDLLAKVWGYGEFRFPQQRIVGAALRRRDVLALLPTGGGKSICFQVPSLLLPGTAIVVSPLISLMQDQVAALRKRGVAAAYLSSTQPKKLQAKVWDAVLAGRIKILYVAPERMASLIERRGRLPIGLFAVDEAHCISEWGHDFRPPYRALGKHRLALGNPPTIAVTATATPTTRDDIARVLRLRRPVVVARSFDRPNLHFMAQRFKDEASRLRHAASWVKKRTGSVIVYVPTRNRTDGVAAVLRRWGVPASPYHAGLPAEARRALLAGFLDSTIDVMVATNAFGMGIDKPNVRQVIHLGVPTRPEAYYQEAGRAGRDGGPSRCSLLWTDGDFRLAAAISGITRPSFFKRNGKPTAAARARRVALRTMRRYVTTWRCRRRVLLEYLGEELDECAGCDRCDGWL